LSGHSSPPQLAAEEGLSTAAVPRRSAGATSGSISGQGVAGRQPAFSWSAGFASGPGVTPVPGHSPLNATRSIHQAAAKSPEGRRRISTPSQPYIGHYALGDQPAVNIHGISIAAFFEFGGSGQEVTRSRADTTRTRCERHSCRFLPNSARLYSNDNDPRLPAGLAGHLRALVE